jgi:hypothetical protein
MANKKNKLIYDLGIHLHNKEPARSIFLPSISTIYTSYTSKTDKGGRDQLSTTIHPDGTFSSLNWFNYQSSNQKDWLFFYPYSLYSAGHAKLNIAESNVKEAMVQKRDRSKAIVIGDSGGFQVATGVLKINWEDPNSLIGDNNSGMCEQILRWLEYTSDYAMILDFPTGSSHIPPARENITIYDYLRRNKTKRFNWCYLLKEESKKIRSLVDKLTDEDKILLSRGKLTNSDKLSVGDNLSLDTMNKLKDYNLISSLQYRVDEHIPKKDPRYKYYYWVACDSNNTPLWGENQEYASVKSRAEFENMYFPICLDATYEHNVYFQQNRQNYDMQFLNVVQGQKPSQIKAWITSMKDFEFEGWSLSSTTSSDFYLMMHALYYLYANGCLTQKKTTDGRILKNDWLHFLGNAKIKASLAYTIIQNKLREHVNPDMKVSFDAASAFLSAARANLYVGWNKKNLVLISRTFMDSATVLKDHKEPFNMRSDVLEDSSYKGGIYNPLEYPLNDHVTGSLGDKMYNPESHGHKLDFFRTEYSMRFDPNKGDVLIYSPIVEKLTYNDLCVRDRTVETKTGFFEGELVNDELAKLFKKGSKDRTYDCLSYIYMMNHNVYVHANAIYQAHDIYEKEGPSAFNATIEIELKHFEKLLDMMFDPNIDFEYELTYGKAPNSGKKARTNIEFLKEFCEDRSKMEHEETFFDNFFT